MGKKNKQVIMHLTMGKMMKIGYNVIFTIRKVTKEETVLVFNLDWKK